MPAKADKTKLVPHNKDPDKMVPEGYEHLYPVWLSGVLGGRPTKCDIDITIHICNALRVGSYPEAACASAGISKGRFYDWLQRGDADEKAGKKPGFGGGERESPFLAFRDCVQIARDAAEHSLTEAIHDAKGDKTWMRLAWILERTRPDKFGQRQQLTIDHTITASIEAMPEPPKTLDEALDRAKQQAVAARELQAIAVDAEYSDVDAEDKPEN